MPRKLRLFVPEEFRELLKTIDHAIRSSYNCETTVSFKPHKVKRTKVVKGGTSFSFPSFHEELWKRHVSASGGRGRERSLLSRC